jgi:hypothetical protein
MPTTNEDNPVSETQEMRNFVAWAYWAVGSFCFYWETLVFITVNRSGTDVELPLIGKCEASEALVFTLSFFWPVLLALHFLVRAHQSVARRGSFTAQFPGVLGDKDIPRQLGYLRVLLFVALVAWPTGLHVFHTCRTFDHMSIVLNVGGKVHPGTKREGWALLGWPTKPVSGEWRWLHWRDEGGVAQPPAADGTPQPNKIVVWPTAVPVLQPWLFAVAGLAFTGALFVEVGCGFRRRKKRQP